MIAAARDLNLVLDQYWEAEKDAEALKIMCWSVLLRTLRDLYTYRDRNCRHRRHLYDNAFNWVFQVSPEDEDQPMSFVWVCDTLDLDHDRIARTVWGLRGGGFQELKKALVAAREKKSEL